MPIVIRPATTLDIDAMYDISCSVHLTPLYQRLIPATDYERFVAWYTPSAKGREAYRQKTNARLADAQWHIWVAESAGVVVGFTLGYEDSETVLLKGLFVDENFQGQGIGAQLFDTSLTTASPGQTIMLEVIASNATAVGMYERRGFRRAGLTPKQFYGAPMLLLKKAVTR